MATADEQNVTLREGLGAPLTRAQMDTNFKELKYVISDFHNHENAADPHIQYFNTSRLNNYLSQTFIRNREWFSVSVNSDIDDLQGFLVDTSGGPITVNLPLNPSNQMSVAFIDPNGTWRDNNLTVDGNGTDIAVTGDTFLTCDMNYFAFGLVYIATENKWMFFR